MVIKKAEFVTSLAASDPFAGEGLSEIAIVGKSNVGKSSLINALAHNQKLARTSSEPGKTRLINLYKFFCQGEYSFLLVDLPGYGFARVSRDEKARWQGMIEGYLADPENLKHVFTLVDIRHEPTQEDIAMSAYLRHYGLEFTVVATKADKLSRAQISKRLHEIGRALQVQPWDIIVTSAQSKLGIDRLIDKVGEVLDAAESAAYDMAEHDNEITLFDEFTPDDKA